MIERERDGYIRSEDGMRGGELPAAAVLFIERRVFSLELNRSDPRFQSSVIGSFCVAATVKRTR